MDPATLTPAQTLHGYARGHRLLACGGDLTELELHELDRLSDLSGYLPADARFDTYHTGFPCGRYYALACTWPDDGAPRRGTVLTHTLLIPVRSWLAEPDPFRWLAAHRRPADVRDTAPYNVPPANPGLGSAPRDPTEADLRGLLRLWFGQGERPILWLDDHTPLDLVRALWSWLWFELRATFAFCTFALQPRSLRGRPFDFLGVPPPALGAFHELGASSAWWRPDTSAYLHDPWLDDLFARGPAAVTALVDRCRAEGLGPPAGPAHLRAAQRFWELADGARTRLPAARARLDMLTRVWPSVPADHPAIIVAVDQLLARQPDAPLDPRPLWDLEYMLACAPVQDHVAAGTALGGRILTCLQEQVEIRLRRAGDRAAEGLVRLYRSAPLPAREALRRALLAVEAVDGWAEPMLEIAGELADEALEQALSVHLPVATLARWIERRIVERPADVELLRARTVALAIHRKSPELAFAAWVGDVSRGLAAAATVVERDPSTVARFEVLLRDLPEDRRIEWCLDCAVEPLRDLAGRHAADLLAAGSLSAAQLAGRCEGHRLGAPIFARVRPWTSEYELAETLKGHPVLAFDLVTLTLANSIQPFAALATAVRAVPSEYLWSQAIRTTLARSPIESSHDGLQALLLRFLGELAAGPLDPVEAGEWLATPAFAAALLAANLWDLERPFLARPPDALHRVIVATTRARALSTDVGPVRPLAILLSRAWGDELARSIPTLLDLLPVPAPADRGDLLLRAELLGAVRRSPPAEGWRLVERCFHPVYRATIADVSVLSLTTWRTSVPTDAAKFWRHWLLDIWCDRRWPPESFLASLAGDRALAERVFKRAAKLSKSTRIWLLGLEHPLRREPGIARVWRDIVND